MKWYSEQNLIDNVARFVPWLAPGIPAMFAYINSLVYLTDKWYFALLVAAVVEGLGLASVHTALSLIEYTKTHKQNQPKTESIIMVCMALLYLIIVVMVNIILDLEIQHKVIIAKALLSLVSIPAAVTLSIRQMHKMRLASEAEYKAEKTAQGKLGALTKRYNELKQKNTELAKTIQGLQQQIEEQNKQAKPVQATNKPESKPTSKSKAEAKQKTEQIACPDCGKMVNGIKGLNGHKAWCKGTKVEVYSNGHTKELA